MIAHLFRDDAPHLSRSIALMVARTFPSDAIYLADMGESTICRAERDKNNETWLKDLPKRYYRGFLDCPWWRNLHIFGRAFGMLKAIIEYIFLPAFSLKSLLAILRGPKYWVFHGSNWTFPTLLFFRLVGKRIILIHWGGHLLTWKRIKRLTHTGYRLFDHIYVLMSPEEQEFAQIAGRDRVSTMPYPFCENDFEKMVARPKWRKENRLPRTILLGNNGFRMNTYNEVLDKLVPEDWDRVVCMLSYGAPATVVDFIAKYRAKFGERFCPWVDTLPYVEYTRIMSECSIYICPCEFQTGLHASYLATLSGQALILRGQNYEWLKDLGAEPMNLDALTDFSFACLASCIPKEDAYARHVKSLRHFFTEVVTEENWARAIKGAFHD